MLERYFSKLETIDRIKESWLGDQIEEYVEWLTAQEYGVRCVWGRVPVVMQFGEFAWNNGVRTVGELPPLVEDFADNWFVTHVCNRSGERERKSARNAVTGPIRQFLRVVLPDYTQTASRPSAVPPFENEAPGFIQYLREERGLSEETIKQYGFFLRRFGAYLRHIGVSDLRELSPVILSGFIANVRRDPGSAGSGKPLSASLLGGLCCSLRVFLRYLHREQILARDLSATVEAPQKHRLSDIPRAISWDEVRQVLDTVDRRAALGRRDYAILLLMITYGLRAREVSALKLGDIDWKRERLSVPERKAGHSTAYPLSSVVGEAIIDYLQHGRPETSEVRIFLRLCAPYRPLSTAGVSCRASCYLRKANIDVARRGSHTFRHTCVQRLVDQEFSFKTIGDYVGHRSPSSTEIYTKVAVETLREVALGEGEAIS